MSPVSSKARPDVAAASSAAFSSPEKHTFILCLLLVLVTLAVYNSASHHPFVNYDDDRYVTENPHVRSGINGNTIVWAFTTTEQANWHPLTWISHALDVQLFGINPAGHHYTNILLQAANAVLLFLLLQWTTGFTWRSLMVAALFALHPLNVESVAWIAERKNLLSMFFFFLALWSYGWYARRPGVVRYVSVAVLFALGLMAKPQIITLPFVLLLWDYWPLGRMFSAGDDSGDGQPFAKLVLEKIPLFVLSAASAIVTMMAQQAGGAVRTIMEFSFSTRLENAIVAYVRYLGKAFWPSNLALIYPHPSDSLGLGTIAAASLFLILVTVAVIVMRRERCLAVGWFWFLGTLVPMIGLVQVGEAAMADRYAYLPFIGVFLMVCWGVSDWAAQRRLSAKILAIPAVTVLLALSAVTYHQLNYWSDNVALWSHTVEITPANFVAQDNLGGALILKGRVDEAMPHFVLAAQINPQDPLSNLNLANYELQQGRLQSAVERFQKVLAMTDDAGLRGNTLSNLGTAYRRLGDMTNATQSYQAALLSVPENANAWIGLGLMAQKARDFTQAVGRFSRAVEIRPSDVSYLLLARALEGAGRANDARAAVQSAQQASTDIEAAQQETARLLAQ